MTAKQIEKLAAAIVVDLDKRKAFRSNKSLPFHLDWLKFLFLCRKHVAEVITRHVGGKGAK